MILNSLKDINERIIIISVISQYY